MRAYHGRDTAASRRSRPGPRRRLGFGLACLMSLAAGCHSLDGRSGKRPRPPQPPAQSAAVSSDPTMLGLGSPTAKGEPKAKPGPEQQFNVHLELGRMYETQGYFEAAITEYQKALDASGHLSPSPSGAKTGETRAGLAHRRMGGAYDRLGRFAQAETHYRAGAEAQPQRREGLERRRVQLLPPEALGRRRAEPQDRRADRPREPEDPDQPRPDAGRRRQDRRGAGGADQGRRQRDRARQPRLPAGRAGQDRGGAGPLSGRAGEQARPAHRPAKPSRRSTAGSPAPRSSPRRRRPRPTR